VAPTKITASDDQREDALIRVVSAASGAGRLAIGVGLFALPGLALKALGFSDPSPQTLAVARVAGGRDIAMGVETLLALAGDDEARLARANAMNAVADAGDSLTFTAALASREPDVREAGMRGAPGAALAAVAGAAAWALLRRRA
jgi:uncharacterized protein DUF4267